MKCHTTFYNYTIRVQAACWVHPMQMAWQPSVKSTAVTVFTKDLCLTNESVPTCVLIHTSSCEYVYG